MTTSEEENCLTFEQHEEWDRKLDFLLQDLENLTQRHEEDYVFLGKSSSLSSLRGPSSATGNMLKDLDLAIRASTKYIETIKDSQDIYNPDGFNLQEKVQHMMPLTTSASLSRLHRDSYAEENRNIHARVQSNSYINGQKRPSSRLKENIDELDSILDNLNRSIASGMQLHANNNHSFVSNEASSPLAHHRKFPHTTKISSFEFKLDDSAPQHPQAQPDDEISHSFDSSSISLQDFSEVSSQKNSSCLSCFR